MKMVKPYIGIAIGSAVVGFLVAAYNPPTWALLSTLIICAVTIYGQRQIQRDLARIKCQVTGHGWAEFKHKYDEEAYCPRCKDLIRTKAPESEGPGMQSGEDTLHRRICR